MRIIKFRAICKVDGKPNSMVNFGLQEFDNGIATWPCPDNINHIDSYESAIMQFSGWKDQIGNEIYEGDILQRYYEDKCEENGVGTMTLSCIFEDGCFGFKGEATGKVLLFYEYDPKDYKIIGNIYENPELLK